MPVYITTNFTRKEGTVRIPKWLATGTVIVITVMVWRLYAVGAVPLYVTNGLIILAGVAVVALGVMLVMTLMGLCLMAEISLAFLNAIFNPGQRTSKEKFERRSCRSKV